MNTTFRFAVKACLLAAVSGALFNQAVSLLAQDVDPLPAPKTASKIRQTAGVQGATSAAPQSAASSDASEVQKQLREIYRKNGREMPSMNMDDLPNTTAPVPSANAPVQVAPNGPVVAPNPPAAKPGKPNWFERTFHVGRGRRQPQPVAQPARPALPGRPQSQPRYTNMQPTPRPAAPAYQPPVVTTTPAPQTPAQPAQPALREPAPIGTPGGVTDLTARPAAPATRPGQRRGIAPELLDESEATEDSETLELNQDDQPKFVNQAPQILSNQTKAPKAVSPYTGLTISPNDMEQKIGSTTTAVPETTASSAADEPAPRSLAVTPDTSAPAPLALDTESRKKTESGAPATAQAAKPKDDLGMIDDEDDEDDDDKPLTLPVDDAGKTAAKPAEKGKSGESAAEKPAQELAPKPTGEKEKRIEKPAPVKGFRGFCPVILKNERKLVEARPHIQSEYHGKTYTFSTVEAKEAFDESPGKYIPAGDGIDVVKQTAGETAVEGTLEHAAWYRGRLYLFSSAESRREFVDAPSKFVVND